MEERQALLREDYHKDRVVDTASSSSQSFICCLIPAQWVLLEYSELPENSNISTLILLLNNMIGSGILAQAYVFMSAGIAVTTVSYFVTATTMYLGTELLLRASYEIGIFDYGDLARNLLGAFGGILVDGCVLFGTGGGIIAYVIIIGSLANSILTEYITSDWFTEPWAVSSGLMCFFVAPMCLVRQFGHLADVSYASILAVVSVMVLVIVYGPQEGAEDRDDSLRMYSASGYFHTIGTVVFAFGFINALFPALKGMHRTDVQLLTRISAWTCAIGASLCFVTGIVGYWSFRDSASDNILNNFTGVVGGLFKLIVIVHLLLYIPADFVIMRHSAFKLFGADVDATGNVIYISVTLFLLTLIVVLANYINSHSDTGLALVLELTGGITGSLLNLLLPAMLFHSACSTDLTWHDLMLLSFVTLYGFFVLIVTTVSNFV